MQHTNTTQEFRTLQHSTGIKKTANKNQWQKAKKARGQQDISYKKVGGGETSVTIPLTSLKDQEYKNLFILLIQRLANFKMPRGVKNSTLWRDEGRLSQRVYITKCQATRRLCYVTHNGVL